MEDRTYFAGPTMANIKKHIVMTRGVNEEVATNAVFAKFVTRSLQKFFIGDWGETASDDKPINDADLKELNEGRYGRILAEYNQHKVGGAVIPFRRIWIIREIVAEDGTQGITILFPEEY